MFSSRCLSTAALALSLLLPCSLLAAPLSGAMGSYAEQQTRHIATYFPGRMAGGPAELVAADYLNQHFRQMGYQSDLRTFPARYRYTSQRGKQSWQKADVTSVIAARSGRVPQEILIVAHLDTFTPQSDSDINHNLGGLTLQGVDDNASGLGVMMELAQRLSAQPTHYGLRFVALGGEEIGRQGSRHYLARMSAAERKNTLLVINLDSLITGDRLSFTSGRPAPSAMAAQSRDRALQLARRLGIPATTRPLLDPASPHGLGCSHTADAFDQAGLPVLSVTATNWALGEHDGCQTRPESSAFPQGTSRHQSQRDNLAYLDRHLPGRIHHRSRDAVRILLPLLKALAQPAPER
jgi:alkaline phosphatase isozyme conversion protein